MDNPAKNIFESTLLGTGGGYGESLVIHLGHGHWMVIDSCINPDTQKSLPLEYLEKIGVDLAKSVKMIVCTHWHDDHIRGLSQLLDKCESAIFSIARATDRKKFLRLLGFDDRENKVKESVSSTREINKCLEILASRNLTIREAIEDRLLISNDENGFKYEVFSLSPSDFVMDQFNGEISTLITEYGATNRKIIVESPNAKSIVLYLKINNLRILLGSDLEVDNNSNQKGWLRILDFSQVINGKSSLYKIPHHGSENGNHDRIWSELLIENPISKLTSWNKKGKLPNKKMLAHIKANSQLSFITSTFHKLKAKPKSRDKDISKIIKKMKPSLEEVSYSYGQVRCRANILNLNPIWSIELNGSAKEIDHQLISTYSIL